MLADPKNSEAGVTCSFCSSGKVEKIAPFGTAQLVRQYYCHHCQSVFEYIRWQKKSNNG
ncbi:PaaD-like zinc ribbon domain-containing protein [Bacillus sp. FJAT-44742]|uniref:PaaD-like zinc ribbon domain-containing protein n=1 Tax=Bacillus sp. FJAT-44742 TaxID=2014005 RepID=UPI0018E22B97